jgi:hypothetical protein
MAVLTGFRTCMNVQMQFPPQLRQMFATILAYNNVKEPAVLWEKYQSDLCEDFLHTARQVRHFNIYSVFL